MDFAIFLTPDGGMLAMGSLKRLGFISLFELIGLVLLLWRVMRRGPACESLFSNTVK